MRWLLMVLLVSLLGLLVAALGVARHIARSALEAAPGFQ